LTAIIEPVSMQDSVDIEWEVRKVNEDHDDVFEFAHVPGGIRILALASGSAKLVVTAGDKTAETWVRVN